jgi:NhaA family Na+:H+ antiporter
MINRIKTVITFVRVEALSGVILLFAAVLAILLKNSSASLWYDGLIHSDVGINLGITNIKISSHFIVNDLLMAIFFLVVGLEIKREVLQGELSTIKSAMLPAVAALGGMLLPAIIYALLNISSDQLLRGWAIPTATDIAFSLGVLSLFGRSIPFSLKIFLTALAIFDDLLAVLVIAFFYTSSLSWLNLFYAVLVYLVLIFINKIGKKKIRYYALPGMILFYFVYLSGIHATIAGVLLALVIPLHGKNHKSKSPLIKLEHNLHPWVAYGVLPVFAFFNSGLDLSNLSYSMIADSVSLGCLLGLFIGKQLGVTLFSWVVIKARLSDLPSGATWTQFYAVSILTGIGFTMSLFIANLAFSDPIFMEFTKLGVISGSLLSALAGSLILYFSRSKTN